MPSSKIEIPPEGTTISGHQKCPKKFDSHADVRYETVVRFAIQTLGLRDFINYFRFRGPYVRNVTHSNFQVTDLRLLALLMFVASRVTECPEHLASHYTTPC